MNFNQAELTIRCCQGGITRRWCISTDGLRKTCLLPSEDLAGDCKTLTTIVSNRQTTMLLEAWKSSQQQACICDLTGDQWKTWFYKVEPPTLTSDSCFCESFEYYLHPLTGRVVSLQDQEFPFPDLQQELLVPAIDCWTADGKLLMLTVAEVTSIAQSSNDSQTVEEIIAAAVESDSFGRSIRLHAVDNALAKQLESSYLNPRAIVSDPTVLIPPRTQFLSATMAGQLLEHIGGAQSPLASVLQHLLEQHSVLAFVTLLWHAQHSSLEQDFLPVLAANKGYFMVHLLRATCSSHLETSMLAIEVLQNLQPQHQSATVFADKFLTAILEAQQGVELLCQAVLDHNGLTPAISADDVLSNEHLHYLEDAPLAAVIGQVISQAAQPLLAQLISRCTAVLLDESSEHSSSCSLGAAVLLDMIVLEGRVTEDEQQQISLDCFGPLLAAAGTASTFQKQILSVLYRVAATLQFDTTEEEALLANHSLAPLLPALQQPGAAGILAAHVLPQIVKSDSGMQAIVPHISQLVAGCRDSGVLSRMFVLGVVCDVGLECPEAGEELVIYADYLLSLSTQPELGLRATAPGSEIREQQCSTFYFLLQYLSNLASMEDAVGWFGAWQHRIQLVIILLRQVEGYATAADPFAEAILTTLAQLLQYLAGSPVCLQRLATKDGFAAVIDFLQTAAQYHSRLQAAPLVPLEAGVTVMRVMSLVTRIVLESANQEQAVHQDQAADPAPGPAQLSAVATVAARPIASLDSLQPGPLGLDFGVVELLLSITQQGPLLLGALGCLDSIAGLPSGAYRCVPYMERIEELIEATAQVMTPNGVHWNTAHLFHLPSLRLSAAHIDTYLAAVHAQSQHDLQEAAITVAQTYEKPKQEPVRRAWEIMITVQLQQLGNAAEHDGRIQQCIQELECQKLLFQQRLAKAQADFQMLSNLLGPLAPVVVHGVYIEA